MANRNHQQWVDRAKGILILLVVLGHVVGAGGNLAGGSTAEGLLAIRKFIYTFHMPAFFLLSGLLWHDNRDRLSEFVFKKAVRLLVPYIVFGLGSVMAFAATVGYANWWQPLVSLCHAGNWPDGEGFRCNSVLWFLPVMFVSVSLMRVLDVYWSSWMLWLCPILWFLRAVCYRYHIDFLPWGIISVLWYFPFMIVGRSVSRLKWRHRCVFVNLVCMGFCVVAYSLVCVFWRLFPARLASWTGFSCSIVMAISASAFVFILAYMSFWEKGGRPLGIFFSICGAASLGVMLIHKFPLVFFQEHVSVIRELFRGDLTLAFCGTFVVCVTSLLVSLSGTFLLRRFFPWLKI